MFLETAHFFVVANRATHVFEATHHVNGFGGCIYQASGHGMSSFSFFVWLCVLV
jgi:hypothetical protein